MRVVAQQNTQRRKPFQCLPRGRQDPSDRCPLRHLVLFTEMAQRASDRASDEVPFLADEEKDIFATARRPSRRETRWARLLPYSGALNLTLLVALIATWALQRHDPNKAYIPNEIYCKWFSTLFYESLSNVAQAPAQSAVEYETVVFTGGLRGDKSKFQAPRARWTPCGMRCTTVRSPIKQPSVANTKANK